MKTQTFITINPNIRFGKPCIKGTRIAVEDILNLVRAGWTIDEIAKEYRISKAGVLTTIDFVAELTREPARVVLVK